MSHSLVCLVALLFALPSHAQQAPRSPEYYREQFAMLADQLDPNAEFEVYTLNPRTALKANDTEAVLYDIETGPLMSNGLNAAFIGANVALDLYATQRLFFSDSITDDKAKHFVAGYVIGNATTGLLQLIIPKGTKHRKLWSFLGGVAAGFVAGVAKEAVDSRTGGDVDGKDIIATGLGGLSGSIVISLGDIKQLFGSGKKARR